jgi:hypothetical protein
MASTTDGESLHATVTKGKSGTNAETAERRRNDGHTGAADRMR